MKQIPLTQGLFAMVDDEDFDRLNAVKWCAHRERQNIYAVRRKLGKIVRMHSEVIITTLDIDHIDGNGLNNTRANLRACTRSQNLRNMNKKRAGCSSQYRGVCWDTRRGNWMSYITGDDGRKYLGRFDSELDAAVAHDIAGFARDPIHFTPNIRK